MIRYLTGEQLQNFPVLKSTMHRDRADQFLKRLGWDVSLDENGEEHDEYDALNPLYVILENDAGQHAGSMRFLPTTGRVMVNEHFLNLTGGVKIASPFIWECTRFCLSPTAERNAACKLMAAGACLMNESCIDHFVGVFDERMERVYKMIGATPTVLGRQSTLQGTIGVGLWEFDPTQFEALCRKANYTATDMSKDLKTLNLPSSQFPSLVNFGLPCASQIQIDTAIEYISMAETLGLQVNNEMNHLYS